jgi:hypothetical protein
MCPAATVHLPFIPRDFGLFFEKTKKNAAADMQPRPFSIAEA